MRRIAAVLAAGLLVVAGCSDSSGPSGEGDINGTYTLRTVNGQNLPFPVLVVGTTYRLEVTSGSLTISGNGSYSSQISLRETEGANVVTETQGTTGTWTRTNNAISFRDNEDGTTLSGSISQNTITFVEDGASLVFRK